ncbi:MULTISPECIES: MaoC/PaaZ C-terminal domain-containing protein [unclassified Sporosarcina]|uniref:MaoC/PaaZ C-terminal domain-containing protein n=1 Tax=unclassified Sporosarcina TaxID=2647733 RepID=UPI002040946F|nr:MULTISPECIES: MaoC/PaaZ C-terminal domain-containing protein [unclassified Sporosarcina]GKV65217.1 hypothetical protein NCCP2331_13700 [Sporosarcina sp. NCCP-2331]GLB55341.1 hypothetical protein NCCP2378_11270 [Sporosarcina sp. NCCP-2378]
MKRINEIQPGETLNIVQLEPVSRLDLIKYAGASGDFNPIHTIDAEAENAGLPGIIAHGLLTMGSLSKIFTQYLEEGFIETYSIRFRGMVFLGDAITLKAILINREESRMHFEVNAINQKSEKVLVGNLVFTLGIPEYFITKE